MYKGQVIHNQRNRSPVGAGQPKPVQTSGRRAALALGQDFTMGSSLLSLGFFLAKGDGTAKHSPHL